MSRFLTANHPDRGKLWAAIDPEAHHLTGLVCERRFASYCSPFKTEVEAREALAAAGAEQIELEDRGRGKRRG